MANEVEKFDPSRVMDGVKERIKDTFVSLIPDEVWNKMVKEVIDDFMNDKVDRWNSDRMTPSGFKVIVLSLIREEVASRLKAYFSTPEWEGTWENGTMVASNKVKDLIKENMADIVSSMLGRAAADFIQNVKYHLQTVVTTR